MKVNRKKLIVYCKTRWNSAYDMLQRLVENRWAISAVLSDTVITKSGTAKVYECTNDDWHIINSMCPALEPMKVATVMLSADENLRSQSFFLLLLPYWTALLLTMKNRTPSGPSRKNLFQQQLTTRFKLDVSSRDSITVGYCTRQPSCILDLPIWCLLQAPQKLWWLACLEKNCNNWDW